MNVISSKKVKIRKPHNCWGCTTLYEPPAEMEVSVSVDGGTIMSAYWCESCQEIMDNMDSFDLQDGFDYGELRANH